MNLVKKILKSEITYALLFFYFYIYIFAGSVTANFFAIAYVLIILLVLLYKTFEEHPFLYALLYPIIFFSGFYDFGMHKLAGVLLGTSFAGYLVVNYKLVKSEELEYTNNLKLSAFVLKNIFVIQVLYSFYFYYSQIIADTRGQNKLDDWKVILFTSTLVLVVWLSQTVISKFHKKLDLVTYSNLVIITTILAASTLLYQPFLEVGSLNIILPYITGFMGILIISVVSYLNSNKDFMSNVFPYPTAKRNPKIDVSAPRARVVRIHEL